MTPERFWSMVDKAGPTMPHMKTPCWVWTGTINDGGYGVVSHAGKSTGVHRLSLILDGRDPGELWALHHCDNPACVRPEHLYAGTHADNICDAKTRTGMGGLRKGAGRKPYADPTTADEAVKMLAPYLPPEAVYPTPGGNIGITLEGAIPLLHKLRRRKT